MCTHTHTVHLITFSRSVFLRVYKESHDAFIILWHINNGLSRYKKHCSQSSENPIFWTRWLKSDCLPSREAGLPDYSLAFPFYFFCSFCFLLMLEITHKGKWPTHWATFSALYLLFGQHLFYLIITNTMQSSCFGSTSFLSCALNSPVVPAYHFSSCGHSLLHYTFFLVNKLSFSEHFYNCRKLIR